MPSIVHVTPGTLKTSCVRADYKTIPDPLLSISEQALLLPSVNILVWLKALTAVCRA